VGSDILIPRLGAAVLWKKDGPDFWILAAGGQYV
jgi:hypothetical protein